MLAASKILVPEKIVMITTWCKKGGSVVFCRFRRLFSFIGKEKAQGRGK